MPALHLTGISHDATNPFVMSVATQRCSLSMWSMRPGGLRRARGTVLGCDRRLSVNQFSPAESGSSGQGHVA